MIFIPGAFPARLVHARAGAAHYGFSTHSLKVMKRNRQVPAGTPFEQPHSTPARLVRTRSSE